MPVATTAAGECTICKNSRRSRHRIVTAEMLQEDLDRFNDAPYVHENNEPKAHAMLFRANECAKRRGAYCLWFHADDEYLDPKLRPKSEVKRLREKERLLLMNDQKRAGIPGLSAIRGPADADHG